MMKWVKSQHVKAALYVFAATSGLLVVASVTDSMYPLSEGAWRSVDTFLTTVVPAVLVAIGSSSLRHVGEGAARAKHEN
ncbi:MAG: hypothetical protein P1V36_00095 [Planctomycetota bacterium]|nr:hypothetical protein [Planctomycetota bacterium]